MAVLVPARQAYSHCASVGNRNSQSAGNSPAVWQTSVSFRQKASTSPKLTFPTGKSSCSGNSSVGGAGSLPITFFHSPCVASNLAIQNPLVSVTSTWSSSGLRSGSVRGLPMRNFPAGHQQNLMPRTVISSPARLPERMLSTFEDSAARKTAEPVQRVAGNNARMRRPELMRYERQSLLLFPFQINIAQMLARVKRAIMKGSLSFLTNNFAFDLLISNLFPQVFVRRV